MLLDDDSKFVHKKYPLSKVVLIHLLHLIAIMSLGYVFLFLSEKLYPVYHEWSRNFLFLTYIIIATMVYKIRFLPLNYNWLKSILGGIFRVTIAGVLGAVLAQFLGSMEWFRLHSKEHVYIILSLYFLFYTIFVEGTYISYNKK